MVFMTKIISGGGLEKVLHKKGNSLNRAIKKVLARKLGLEGVKLNQTVNNLRGRWIADETVQQCIETTGSGKGTHHRVIDSELLETRVDELADRYVWEKEYGKKSYFGIMMEIVAEKFGYAGKQLDNKATTFMTRFKKYKSVAKHLRSNGCVKGWRYEIDYPLALRKTLRNLVVRSKDYKDFIAAKNIKPKKSRRKRSIYKEPQTCIEPSKPINPGLRGNFMGVIAGEVAYFFNEEKQKGFSPDRIANITYDLSNRLKDRMIMKGGISLGGKVLSEGTVMAETLKYLYSTYGF